MAQKNLWAQPPLPFPPIDEEVDEELADEPFIADFYAIEYPGVDHWLISGQLVGCKDPSGIGVTIGGTLSTGATTDSTGYFEVLVIYGGVRDTITADATVNGIAAPQAISEIGA